MKKPFLWEMRNRFRLKLLHITNPYEYLDMGDIRANSIIIDKNDTAQWVKEGWIEKPHFHDERYFPKVNQTVMLGKPQTILAKGTDYFIDKMIFCYQGYNFWRLLIGNSDGTEKENLVFAVFAATEYILVDNRILSCHPKLHTVFHPWISQWANDDIEQWDDLSPVLNNSIIKDIKLNDRSAIISFIKHDKLHTMEFLKNDERLAPFINFNYKFDSFKEGTIGEHIVVTKDKTVLHSY